MNGHFNGETHEEETILNSPGVKSPPQGSKRQQRGSRPSLVATPASPRDAGWQRRFGKSVTLKDSECILCIYIYNNI